MKKTLLVFVAVGVCLSGLVIGGDAVFARTVAKYDAIVPRTGAWYSSQVKKANTSKAVNNNTSIGGNKELITGVAAGSKLISKTREIRKGERITLTYNRGENKKGRKVRLKMNVKLTTIVNVQARGTWSPDTK